MNVSLTIKTGTLHLPVVRDGQAVGELCLQPDDTAFLGRFYALIPTLEAQRSALASALDSQKNTPEATLAAMQQANDALRAEIDTVFGSGTAGLVFGTTCSLSMVQQFFEGIAAALEQVRAPKIAAYTAPVKAVLA